MKSLPTEKPILFNGPMVRAILDGRKTMTRRVIKTKAFLEWVAAGFSDEFTKNPDNLWAESSPYRPGMKLWVRETWAIHQPGSLKPETLPTFEYETYTREGQAGLEKGYDLLYRATAKIDPDFPVRWRPSIFMPRWASRITLEVTGVKVERLREISNEDIRKEGATVLGCVTHRLNFEQLWDSINSKTYPWSSNPFVWVIEFRRLI